jgi:hypothetical protein
VARTITGAMWRQGYSAFFAYWGAAAAFGQEQSVVAAESGRSTSKLRDAPLAARPLERKVSCVPIHGLAV